METFFLTVYVMVWPVIVGAVLLLILQGFIKEWAQARREGRDII